MKTVLATEQASSELSTTVALEMFFQISELWCLSNDEQIKLLGAPGRSTFFKWKKSGGQLTSDTIERISHIIGIFKCLQILFTSVSEADDWIRKPNTYFDDLSALNVMLRGQVVDIYRVRQYLDAQRGG